jgi:hypothetical protein
MLVHQRFPNTGDPGGALLAQAVRSSKLAVQTSAQVESPWNNFASSLHYICGDGMEELELSSTGAAARTAAAAKA